MKKKLISKNQKGQQLEQKEDSIQQKKKLIPRKPRYLNPHFVNTRPVPMNMTNKQQNPSPA